MAVRATCQSGLAFDQGTSRILLLLARTASIRPASEDNESLSPHIKCSKQLWIQGKRKIRTNHPRNNNAYVWISAFCMLEAGRYPPRGCSGFYLCFRQVFGSPNCDFTEDRQCAAAAVPEFNDVPAFALRALCLAILILCLTLYLFLFSLPCTLPHLHPRSLHHEIAEISSSNVNAANISSGPSHCLRLSFPA